MVVQHTQGGLMVVMLCSGLAELTLMKEGKRAAVSTTLRGVEQWL